MADTCIVCLGDLSTGTDAGAAQFNTTAKSPLQDAARDGVSDLPVPTQPTTNDTTPELIAHIQPCGHDLHNACLTPWVERANSCPICRATFHLVELTNHVGGEVISSYTVDDRTQVAELDPTLFLEIPEEEDDDEPCQACGESDNEDFLMFCDGCDQLWHTYCVGLHEVPRGSWFCENCRVLREHIPRGPNHFRQRRTARRRTRGQRRRYSNYAASHDWEWNHVWHSVFERLGMDLDFPNDDDEAPATVMRRHRQSVEANRQAHNAWLSRVRVAELAGAGHHFRESESAILNGNISNGIRRPRASPHPQVESPDETLAWNAFEQAREAPAESSSAPKRKRKSRSRSTTPEVVQDEGPITVKRRRIAVPRNRQLSPSGSPSERPQQPRRPSSTPLRPAVNESAAPSFLQSLLQEVEESAHSRNQIIPRRPSPRNGTTSTADQHSPRPSSPALSPLPSNHSSPRATSATPPPLGSGFRPSSPTGLSSSIQPVFPTTEYSPLRTNSPEPKEKEKEKEADSSPPRLATTINNSSNLAQPTPKSRKPQILDRPTPITTPITSRPRIDDNTSPRLSMSFMAKADVQKLVSAALKPHYNEQKISKDEYTMINRDISRMLYEKIGNFDSLDVDGKAKWEKVAGEEVNKAVGALRAQA